MLNICLLNSPHYARIKLVDCDSAHQVGESIVLYNNCLRRRRTDILYVGESTLDVGEQAVGKPTRRRNDRNRPFAAGVT